MPNIQNKLLDRSLGALPGRLDEMFLDIFQETPCMRCLTDKICTTSNEGGDRRIVKTHGAWSAIPSDFAASRGLYGYSRQCPWDEGTPELGQVGIVRSFGITKKKDWFIAEITVTVDRGRAIDYTMVPIETITDFKKQETTLEDLYQPGTWPEPDFLIAWFDQVMREQALRLIERQSELALLATTTKKYRVFPSSSEPTGAIFAIESIGHDDDEDSKRSTRVRRVVREQLGWSSGALTTVQVDFDNHDEAIRQILGSMVTKTFTYDVIVVYGSPDNSDRAEAFCDRLRRALRCDRPIPVLRAGLNS